MRRALAVLLTVTWMVALPVTPGAGGVPVRVAIPRVEARAAEVVVQGMAVLRLRGPRAEERATEVARRLTEIVTLSRGAFVVTLAHLRGASDLLLNGRHVMTVNAAEARLNWTRPRALAFAWAARLREALSRQTVTLTPGLLLLIPGQTGTVAVTAFYSAPVVIGPHDEWVAVARAVDGSVSVEARGLGSMTVPISVGGGQAALQVVVRQAAGMIPEAVTVSVTGDLRSPAVIREAVERRIDQAVVREPGASVGIGPFPAFDASASAAESLVLTVPVRVRGPSGVPVEGTVRVTVLRQTVEVIDPSMLLVSNRPEAVVADGVLFSEEVDARLPIRLLYHHKNATSDQSRILSIVLTNRSARVAQLLMITGLAGPSVDTLYVGHAATARFLQNLVAGRGYVVEIAPRSSFAFTAQTMPPLQIVSGILQFHLLQGEELGVRVQIRSPLLPERAGDSPVSPEGSPHPKGTFAGPTVTIARVVDPTQATTIADLGFAATLRDIRTGEPLNGDYGVVYRLTITATNPLPREVSADIVATAANGPARGAFLIDGRLVEVSFRPNDERVLWTLTVPPGQTVQIQLVTMPAAGSNYPVRLTLRPRE